MRFTVVFDVGDVAARHGDFVEEQTDEDLKDLFRELLEDEGMQNFSVIGVER